VHSFADNALSGDYGPTIVLEHRLGKLHFFTLYGHLSQDSLTRRSVGEDIAGGSVFAYTGSPPINGDWPPHLHFQIIKDMGSYYGDFPGVASVSQRHLWCGLCPDPQYLLMLEGRV